MEVVFSPNGGTQVDQFPRGHCWDCDYSLRGLCEWRCPECGRAFDPHDLASMNFGAAGPLARFGRKAWAVCKPILVLGSCLGICWLTFIITEGQLPALLLLPGIYLAVRRRWALLAVFLLFTPFPVAVFHYANEYRKGSPIYVNGNAPIVYPRASIDRRTRIRGVRPGCGFSRRNEVYNWAEAATGTLMYHLMGPPPGAYAGPYPTEAEAEAALASSGMKIHMDPEMIDTISLPSGKVVLPTSLRCQYQEHKGSVDQQLLVPTMAIWNQRCLIVKVPRDMNPKPYGPYEDIYLIDIQKSQMFAMYSRPR
jgi:hypothetical protein